MSFKLVSFEKEVVKGNLIHTFLFPKRYLKNHISGFSPSPNHRSGKVKVTAITVARMINGRGDLAAGVNDGMAHMMAAVSTMICNGETNFI